MKRITLIIGDVAASDTPAIIETVLGSCVSVCLWDKSLRIGGMNHIMLPAMSDNVKNPNCCAQEAIDKLIGDMLKMGADMRNLCAKVFGGGRAIKQFSERLDVGKQNVRVTREILKNYNIPVVKEFTAMAYGIKVVFYTDTGRAFVKKLEEVI